MNNHDNKRFDGCKTIAAGIGALLAGLLIITVVAGQEKPMDKAVVSLTKAHLRVARPTDNLVEVMKFYRDGLGFEVLYEFKDHDGFDGVMLGHKGALRQLGNQEVTFWQSSAIGDAYVTARMLRWAVCEVENAWAPDTENSRDADDYDSGRINIQV
jgi:hypothetical protein